MRALDNLSDIYIYDGIHLSVDYLVVINYHRFPSEWVFKSHDVLGCELLGGVRATHLTSARGIFEFFAVGFVADDSS